MIRYVLAAFGLAVLSLSACALFFPSASEIAAGVTDTDAKIAKCEADGRACKADGGAHCYDVYDACMRDAGLHQ